MVDQRHGKEDDGDDKGSERKEEGEARETS